MVVSRMPGPVHPGSGRFYVMRDFKTKAIRLSLGIIFLAIAIVLAHEFLKYG
jgi:hypothetical protein